MVLGAGKRLFGGRALPGSLRLVGSSVSGSGVVVTRYERAGDVVTGTIGS